MVETAEQVQSYIQWLNTCGTTGPQGLAGLPIGSSLVQRRDQEDHHNFEKAVMSGPIVDKDAVEGDIQRLTELTRGAMEKADRQDLLASIHHDFYGGSWTDQERVQGAVRDTISLLQEDQSRRSRISSTVLTPGQEYTL